MKKTSEPMMSTSLFVPVLKVWVFTALRSTMCNGLMHSTIDEVTTVFLQDSKTFNSSSCCTATCQQTVLSVQ